MLERLRVELSTIAQSKTAGSMLLRLWRTPEGQALSMKEKHALGDMVGHHSNLDLNTLQRFVRALFRERFETAA
jgi:hypothetical protein